MTYYQITNKIQFDESTGTWPNAVPMTLRTLSHDWVFMNTGGLLTDYERLKETGEPFAGPLVCQLDRDDDDEVDDAPASFMPTLFLSPTLIATKAFYQDLLAAGVSNIEAHPVIVQDPENHSEIDDYLLLNVLGRVACADQSRSQSNDISDSGERDMQLMTSLVIDSTRAGELDLFLLDEDTSCIIISDRIYQAIKNNRYTGVYFEPIDTV